MIMFATGAGPIDVFVIMGGFVFRPGFVMTAGAMDVVLFVLVLAIRPVNMFLFVLVLMFAVGPVNMIVLVLVLAAGAVFVLMVSHLLLRVSDDVVSRSGARRSASDDRCHRRHRHGALPEAAA
jgi:hypothetical protein